MEQHCVIGAVVLKDSDAEVLKKSRIVALTHHEKFDGTGYEVGLKGHDIPINARIFAVADVFDALTSPRPYKEAWTFDRAVHEIWQGKGTHFDPRLVSVFLNNLPTIKRIYHQQHTPSHPLN